MKDIDVSVAAAPDVVLIERVNWTVAAKEFWVVCGLPGSGKTDLLSTAAGLIRPLSGIHRLFGSEIQKLSEEELIQLRLRVGLVFASDGRLFNHLTVAENLSLPLCYHGNCDLAETHVRVQTVLEALGLSHWSDNTPGTLNRNIRPRVALARALVLNPDLLLLDDPLRGRDPREIRWWLDFIAALHEGHPILNRRPLTIVVTADDFRPWLDQATKFALIKDKAWMSLGGRADVRGHQDPLLRELLSHGFIRD